MLSMEQIQSFYPENLRPFKRNILREYIQYKILEAVFSEPRGGRLAFLGGTCIHIVHGNPRFSEDLDFDNIGLSIDSLGTLAGKVRQALSREGYLVELKTASRGAFRANFRFVDLLQAMGVTRHREEKLLVHLDAEPQEFEYPPERAILNKFDVFCGIQAVPADILLAQKITCILKRVRPMGRDFYDAVFLFGKTLPNMAYLSRKAGLNSPGEIWTALRQRCRALDFGKLARDLAPLVADPRETRKVALFPDFVALKGKTA